MNIGLVCPYEWTVPGGVGNHVRALAGELRRAGHQVDVLAPAERPVAEPGFVGLGGSVGVPYNGSVARIAFGPRTLVRVRRAVARGGYDLLHVHEPLSPSAGLLAVLQSRRGGPGDRQGGPPVHRGVPVVGTFHANLDRSVALEAATPLLRRVYDRLGARIAVSASARDTWQRRFGGTMAVVPNGVAPEFFASPKPLEGWKQDGPTILFVGRLEPRKGLEYLVRAFLRLKPAFPRLRLLVVGRDDRGQQHKAMAMVPPRLRPDLVFVGSVPQADLPSWYASADVFCAPSLGGESFGIVLAEAMAVGLPVVCSDIGGYRDVVRDGADGLLVPPRDPEALAEALAGLLDNPARLAAMGEAAAAAARRYAWEVVAGQVAEVYRTALQG
jgi:phosphatidylinositol alpha-mannosyltransferase